MSGETVKDKLAFIAARAAEQSVILMCRVLSASTSRFNARRATDACRHSDSGRPLQHGHHPPPRRPAAVIDIARSR
ncbi:hypothetical protein DWF04_017515 [Cereibacter sphaeroides f. sp. denitrificans]